MHGAERVGMAHRRFGKSALKFETPMITTQTKANESVPIDIGNFQLKKLTAAERDQCRKEGSCFRCREKGHMANKFPKWQGNWAIQWVKLQFPQPTSHWTHSHTY